MNNSTCCNYINGERFEFDEPISYKQGLKDLEKKGYKSLQLYEVTPKFYKDGVNESFKMRGIDRYLTDENDFINELGLKSYLITLNYDTETSFHTAWKEVYDESKKICKGLIQTDIIDIHFCASTIEHVHNVPQNHKDKKIYKCFDLKRLDKHVAKSELTFLKSDLDLMEYTAALHNIATELLYTQNIIPRCKDFIRYLQELQFKTGKCMDKGISYPFEKQNRPTESKPNKYVYKMNRELFLAYNQIENSLTTSGYPHIHISFLSSFSSNYKDVTKKLKKFIKSTTNFIDIDIARHKHEPPFPTKSLMYILKNHACAFVRRCLELHLDCEVIEYEKQETINGKNVVTIYERLKNPKKPKIRPIVNCYLSSKSKHSKYIYGLLKDISYRDFTDEDKFSSNPNGRNKTVGLAIYLVNKSKDEFIPVLRTLPVPINDFEILDPEIQKGKFKLINKVQNDMLLNGYVICDGILFKHLKGSKTTFTPAMIGEREDVHLTIELYLQSIKNIVGNEKLAVNEISKIMRTPTLMKENTETNEVVIDFPRITINYRLVEFEDFYFCISSRKIFKTQTKYFTYRYCPVKLENLNFQLTELMEKSLWCKYLRMSNIYTIQDLSILFLSLLTRRDSKQSAILLIGDSNTFKTLSISVFEYMFPSFLVGVLTEVNKHHVYDQMLGKVMVVINESNTFLRSVLSSKDRATCLLALEGGNGVADQKHGGVVKIDHSKHSLIMTANIEKDDVELFINDTLLNRINICHTRKSLCKNTLEAYTKRAAQREGPLISIFASMCNVAVLNNEDYLCSLPIFDVMSPEDIKFIEITSMDVNSDYKLLSSEDIFYFSVNSTIKSEIKSSGIKFECDKKLLPSIRLKTNADIAEDISIIAHKCKTDKIGNNAKDTIEFQNELEKNRDKHLKYAKVRKEKIKMFKDIDYSKHVDNLETDNETD